MDLELYRNFIAIVEGGSLSAAAKRVHVAQPALTAQLKALQKKYGATLLLVRRGARSVEVTAAGSILYNKAKYLCALEDTTQREITACENGVAGTLKLSLSPSMAILFIQNFLSKFCLENPSVNYELYEVPILEQTRQLLEGVTEIGIANAPLL
ncbi:MAG: LysR family transcriptional regulator, partial [Acidaminococcaceae bacterium]